MPRVPLLLISLLAAPHALAQSGEAWTGQLTSYAWGSGLGGQLTPFTGGPTLRIDKSFAEVLEDLDGAAFVSAFARRDRLVLLGDLSHARSSKAGRLPPGLPARGALRQSSMTLAAGWRVHDDGTLAADLLGGLRRWDLRAEVAVPAAGLARSASESFTDPLLAVRANLSLSPRWSLIAYADAGGFGVGSEQTWQWLLTANLHTIARWVRSFGLRQLSVDYRDGGTRVDATLAGPLLGVSWRF